MKNKEIKINEEQYNVLSSIYEPNKNYDVVYKDTKIDSYLLEDIKSKVLVYTLDQISNGKNRSSESKNYEEIKSRLFEIIPYDLTELDEINKMDLNKIRSLSNKYNDLKILFKEGYIIWKYGEQPTVYIKDKKIYYSPSMSQPNKKTYKSTVKKQVNIILREMEQKSKKVTCKICNKNQTSDLVWDREQGIIPVCESCMTHSTIVGKVGKIQSKGN